MGLKLVMKKVVCLLKNKYRYEVLVFNEFRLLFIFIFGFNYKHASLYRNGITFVQLSVYWDRKPEKNL